MTTRSAKDLTRVDDDAVYEAIVSAIDAFDPTREAAGSTVDNAIAALGDDLRFDGLVTTPEGVFLAGENQFEVVGTLFLADQAGYPANTASVTISGYITADKQALIREVSVGNPEE